MNKREFVLGGCTTLATGVVLSTPARAEPVSAARATTRRLARFPDLETRASLDAWRRYVGERFVQPLSGGARALVLRRVDQRHADESGEQFTLLFAAAMDATLSAGAQGLRHGATGQQIPVFLQPAGEDMDGAALFRADFNRLV